MIHHLSETDMAQLETLKERANSYYHKEDAIRLERVIERVLQKGLMDETDIYELIDVLPKIIPMPVEEDFPEEKQGTDWKECIDENHSMFKREMEKLYQMLSNRVFMQNAIYQRNLEHRNPHCKIRSNDIKHGI